MHRNVERCAISHPTVRSSLVRFTPLRMLRRASCGCHSSHYGHHCGTHAPQCGQNGGISARAFSRSTANAIECAEWSNQASTVSTQRRQVGTSTREYAVAAKRWDGSAGHAQSIQRLYGDAANPNSAYSSAIGRACPFAEDRQAAVWVATVWATVPIVRIVSV